MYSPQSYPKVTSDWMRSNRLQLNTSKTEILWCLTSRRRHLLPTTAVRVSVDYVTPSSAVRNLGIMIVLDVNLEYCHQVVAKV